MRHALLLIAAALSLAAQVPRPEHPLPQFQREQWLNLNGRWEFEFDDADAGLDAHWQAPGRKFTRAITVPFCFESRLSGIGDTSFHPAYFGFRTVGTEGGRIVINNRPVYLKMVLDQGYWPESILTPPSDEAIQYDIRMTKEMGFNGARKHQKVEDPRYLYWADRMGLYVSGEIGNAYVFDDDYVERFTNEWMETVERDYNHPSVIMWVPINESWGTPNLRDPRQQGHLKANYWLTKSLDPTRPVIDNDGWEHADATDIFAVHNYARTGEDLLRIYKDLGEPGTTPASGGRPPLAPGYQYNGTPVTLSEFGGIAYIPQDHTVPAESWGYSGVEKTADAALARMRGLYQAIAKLPFAGLCYTQLTDVEQEVNGLLTFDRKPKFELKAIREMNELVR